MSADVWTYEEYLEQYEKDLENDEVPSIVPDINQEESNGDAIVDIDAYLYNAYYQKHDGVS